MTAQATVSGRLQEYALAQLDLALHYLTDGRYKSDTAIHETRRCLKRVRALLRLVKAGLPSEIFDRDNLYLRDQGRRLAELRDAAVMLETFAALKKTHTSHLPRRAWREFKQELLLGKSQSEEQKKKRMKAVAAKLRIARARIAKWPLESDDDAVWRQGVRKMYRRGRRAMKQVRENPTSEAFHEWRKQVNHLRHQLQLLRELQLGEVKEPLKLTRALASTLGRQNDLAVLAQRLLPPNQTEQSSGQRALEQLIQTMQTDYQKDAFQQGAQLYRRSAKSFSKSLHV
ncbi:MAG TPA: CHAD domain-containing protein [Blastocatellia bacterium]|nr:CHAD domain-containing protein [Blastocatellia bacterium]